MLLPRWILITGVMAAIAIAALSIAALEIERSRLYRVALTRLSASQWMDSSTRGASYRRDENGAPFRTWFEPLDRRWFGKLAEAPAR